MEEASSMDGYYVEVETDVEASTSPVQMREVPSISECSSVCKNNNTLLWPKNSDSHCNRSKECGTSWPNPPGDGGDVVNEEASRGVVLDSEDLAGSLSIDAEVEELPGAAEVSDEDAGALAELLLMRSNSTVIDQEEMHHAESSMLRKEEQKKKKNAPHHHHLCEMYKRELSLRKDVGGLMHSPNNLIIAAKGNNNNASSFSMEGGRQKNEQFSSSSIRSQQSSSQLQNLCIDSGVTDPESFKNKTSPSHCCSSLQCTDSCVQSATRQLKSKSQKHDKAAPQSVATGNSSCEDVDQDVYEQDEREEEEEDAGSIKVSSSGLEDNTHGKTHREYIISKIRDKEFEGAKLWSLHRKSYPQYALRRNPKQSHRFIDQNCTIEERSKAAAAAPAPSKKMRRNIFSSENEVRTCTECGKRFGSWKALFGHMWCHPDRKWRGIQPPDIIPHQQGQMSNGSHLLSRRNKPLPNVIVVVESGLGSGTESSQGKASDDESDDTGDQSIEAAYVNGGDIRRSVQTWQKGKRTKRLRQSVQSLQTAGYAPENSQTVMTTNPMETQNQREMVDALMLLKAVELGRERNALKNPQESQEGTDKEHGFVRQQRRRNVEDVEQQQDHMSKKENHHHREEKRRIVRENVDNNYVCEDDKEDTNEFKTCVQRVRARKYRCATCKKVFKSHQALGGHRSSHKRVKAGCYIQTNLGEEEDGSQDQSLEEEITEEDETMNMDNELLPHEEEEEEEEEVQDVPHKEKKVQDVSQNLEPEDHERSHSLADIVKDDNENMLSIPRKTKAHTCAICHCVFSSDQALGGHKRCHQIGASASTSTAAVTEPTGTQTDNQQHLPAAAAATLAAATLAEDHQVTGYPNGRRGLEQSELDLNMPAPKCDDSVEPAGSISACTSPPSSASPHQPACTTPLLKLPFSSIIAKNYASSGEDKLSAQQRRVWISDTGYKFEHGWQQQRLRRGYNSKLRIHLDHQVVPSGTKRQNQNPKFFDSMSQ